MWCRGLWKIRVNSRYICHFLVLVWSTSKRPQLCLLNTKKWYQWCMHIWPSTLEKCSSSNAYLGSIIIRPGGFHTLMTFLGCVWYLMANSGLSVIDEIVYAGNTVPRLLSGKVLYRALRGHKLVDLVLNTILLKDIFQTIEVDPNLIKTMLDDAMKGKLDLENISSNTTRQKLDEALSTTKHLLFEIRTSSLWLHYANDWFD